ncbi:hypothetical protein [Xenorhabdus vietnamensis]|uniref:hypothetical protein n=1 Tax=Xenorhabdus vietnamensis TaxID=351656 RepID=UPI00142DCA69|nr:hypothetical protein [Xenorhabdus vietnamensis]
MENGIYGHSRFCNTEIEKYVGLLESIRRLNRLYTRASMSSAPDEPQKNIRLPLSHSVLQVLQQAGWPFVSSIISIRKT